MAAGHTKCLLLMLCGVAALCLTECATVSVSTWSAFHSALENDNVSHITIKSPGIQLPLGAQPINVTHNVTVVGEERVTGLTMLHLARRWEFGLMESHSSGLGMGSGIVHNNTTSIHITFKRLHIEGIEWKMVKEIASPGISYAFEKCVLKGLKSSELNWNHVLDMFRPKDGVNLLKLSDICNGECPEGNPFPLAGGTVDLDYIEGVPMGQISVVQSVIINVQYLHRTVADAKSCMEVFKKQRKGRMTVILSIANDLEISECPVPLPKHTILQGALPNSQVVFKATQNCLELPENGTLRFQDITTLFDCNGEGRLVPFIKPAPGGEVEMSNVIYVQRFNGSVEDMDGRMIRMERTRIPIEQQEVTVQNEGQCVDNFFNLKKSKACGKNALDVQSNAFDANGTAVYMYNVLLVPAKISPEPEEDYPIVVLAVAVMVVGSLGLMYVIVPSIWLCLKVQRSENQKHCNLGFPAGGVVVEDLDSPMDHKTGQPPPGCTVLDFKPFEELIETPTLGGESRELDLRLTVSLLNEPEIGSGMYKIVVKGLLDSRLPVAVKILHTYNMDWRQCIKTFQTELRAFADMPPHRNIIHCHGANLDPDNEVGSLYIVEELMHTSLYDMVHDDQAMGQCRYSTLIQIFLDVAKGVQHLHACKVHHCDLKPGNVLLDRHCRAKLCDFGLCRLGVMSTVSAVFKGTAPYMAPEVLLCYCMPGARVNGKKIDVYSFAVVMWESLTGGSPQAPGENVYKVVAMASTKSRLSRCSDRSQSWHSSKILNAHMHRFSFPDACPDDLKQLVWDCTKFHYDDRPNFGEIVERLEAMKTAEWTGEFVRAGS